MTRLYPETVCLDFDLACSTRLFFYDLELEKRRLEAAGGAMLGKALGGSDAKSNHSVEHW
jgi:hypothetical protein